MANTYTPGAIELAKRKGLHLVKFELNGRHAKRGTVQMSGPCGPKTAEMLLDVFARLCNEKERMK